MSKIPYLKIKYKNQVDLVDKLLKIYDLSKEYSLDDNKRNLRNFERQVLNYYIRHGYSKETKNLIEKDTGKKLNAIVQIDFLLKESGYLEDMENNYRMKKLNPYLEKIRQDFILKRNIVYGLHFDNE
jgi:hypothetical protein